MDKSKIAIITAITSGILGIFGILITSSIQSCVNIQLAQQKLNSDFIFKIDGISISRRALSFIKFYG